jgi:hypothetical protein
MKAFLYRLLKFSTAVMPIVILLIGYVVYDPFKVIYKYPGYDTFGPDADTNWDNTSTQNFINHNPTYHYNSFIFGSSRSMAFRPSSWKKYLKPTDVPFAFNSSGESIFGIYTKLKYLDSIGCPLNNVLVVICHDQTFKLSGNSPRHLFIKSPVTSGESRYEFQKVFVKAYFHLDFLKAYYTYKFTHKFAPWMEGQLVNDHITYNKVTNEMRWVGRDSALQNDPQKYYRQKMELFYHRGGATADTASIINAKQLYMLKQIAQIFTKHHTNYRVVISPLYDQRKFSPADIKDLTSLFGNRLFDFSGENNFTKAITNYYESSHYKPMVGDSILKTIYKNDL